MFASLVAVNWPLTIALSVAVWILCRIIYSCRSHPVTPTGASPNVPSAVKREASTFFACLVVCAAIAVGLRLAEVGDPASAARISAMMLTVATFVVLVRGIRQPQLK